MKHMGLFEGIGGFSLAARWAGWTTPVMVEWNTYCQAVLKKNFPDATIFSDIRNFDGQPYAGQIDIITGGFPCQPFSHAGRRAGTADDRYLWPEMLRVIREVGPEWVVGENVAGLLTMDGGRILRGILADLENAGYRPEIYLIPALAVGAPHRRDRLWIVAHASGKRPQTLLAKKQNAIRLLPKAPSFNVFDTSITRLPKKEDLPDLRRDDGLSNWMDRIKSLGNAIVPQVAYQIFQAINEAAQ